MGNRSKKKKRKNSKEFKREFHNNLFLKRAAIIWICTVIILAGMVIGAINVKKKIASYEVSISELSTEISDLKDENEKLKDQMDHQDSDEYIEKIARERLGMIGKDEYILKESDNQTDSSEKSK